MQNFYRISSLLLLGATLGAQSPVLKLNTVVVKEIPSGACPVGFSARHANGGAVLNVSPASTPRGPAYDLRFVPRNGGAIVGAKVTLHGLSGHHVVPAGGRSGVGAAETSESFNLTLRSDGTHLFTSVVYLSKLTGVTSVELNQITYADGTKWHEVTGSPCAVAPDGYMLVAGAR